MFRNQASDFGLVIGSLIKRPGKLLQPPQTSVTDLTLSFPISSAAPIGLDIDTRDNNLRDSMTVEIKTQYSDLGWYNYQEL